jgi:hypothetical protein
MSVKRFTDSNNKYHNCPAIMSDGRNFTDYRAIRRINNLLGFNNQLKNDYTYREFLIQNAAKIMEHNRNMSIQNNICDQCPDMYKGPCLSSITYSSHVPKNNCLEGVEDNV